MSSRARAPRWVIHGLIVLASLLAIFSGVNVWVESQVLDTDEWVELSDQVLANEEVREVLAAYLVDELYRSVDIAEDLDTRLPDNIDGLAGLIAGAFRDPAINAVDRFLATERVRQRWHNLNETAHSRLVNVLTDDTAPALSTADGSVTLDLGELVQQIGLDFGLSPERLENLPEDVGQITLLESDQLETAQDLVSLVKIFSIVLFLLVVVLYGAAIYLAGPDRRRVTIREVGWALGLSGALVLIAIRIGSSAAETAVADNADGREAFNAVADVGTSLLKDLAWAGLIYGAVIVGFASLIGPSRIATWVRKLLAPVLVTKPVGTWLSAIGAFLFVLYLLPGESLSSWWRALLFVLVFALALESLRRQLRSEFPDASLADSWDVLRSGPSGVGQPSA